MEEPEAEDDEWLAMLVEETKRGGIQAADRSSALADMVRLENMR